MFGHDNHHDEENNLPEPDGNLVHDHGVTPPPADDDTSFLDDVEPTTVTPTPTTDDSTDAEEPSAPAVDLPAAAPAVDEPAVVAPVAAAPAPAVVPADTDKLLDIKQQALQQLTPLVGHLEQSPEEKFRTTMMMIQAADNHELVGTAYEAAQQIADEKVRAQALLDIVNEINYFTHNGSEA
jgi:hypothetical protein